MRKQEFDHSFTFKGHSSVAKKAMKYGISISQVCRDALDAAVTSLGDLKKRKDATKPNGTKTVAKRGRPAKQLI